MFIDQLSVEQNLFMYDYIEMLPELNSIPPEEDNKEAEFQ